jgi:hypothetical protein
MYDHTDSAGVVLEVVLNGHVHFGMHALAVTDPHADADHAAPPRPRDERLMLKHLRALVVVHRVRRVRPAVLDAARQVVFLGAAGELEKGVAVVGRDRFHGQPP